VHLLVKMNFPYQDARYNDKKISWGEYLLIMVEPRVPKIALEYNPKATRDKGRRTSKK